MIYKTAFVLDTGKTAVISFQEFLRRYAGETITISHGLGTVCPRQGMIKLAMFYRSPVWVVRVGIKLRGMLEKI